MTNEPKTPAAQPAGEYPPLPAPERESYKIWRGGCVYTANQMRAYVDADRAMRAQPAVAQAAPTAVAGHGWQWVPVAPTEAMVQAMKAAWSAACAASAQTPYTHRLYAAALAAAPQPPAAAQDQQADVIREAHEALYGNSSMVTTNSVTAAAHISNGLACLLIQYRSDEYAERAHAALKMLSEAVQAPQQAAPVAMGDALVQHVIDTAREVADRAVDLGEDFHVASHVMAPLSLALDEYDAARAQAQSQQGGEA